MFENIISFFKNLGKKEEKKQQHVENSKDAAKERLHLVLMQDRANVSADFLELMKQEIIDVIKKYIEIDEKEIDVRLTNKENEDGTNGAPALYANIPILNIKNEARKIDKQDNKKEEANTKKQEKNNKEEKNVQEKEIKNEKNIKKEESKDKSEDTENADLKKQEEQKDEADEKVENKEENIDLENEEKVAEEKETKEKLNQN